MNILKIISVISFLLIGSLDPKGFPAFIMVLIYLVDFVQSFTYSNLGISWEGGIVGISVIAMLIFIVKSNSYKNRYFLLLCFAGLLGAAINFTGILNLGEHYNMATFLWFIIPFSVFIISSLLLIAKNFNKIDYQTDL
ncbi:hypothetical protein ACVVIH_16200 [Chryseobacterium arthrosphaerae]|uniref:hypothetical protein n=1 Tax=Chryseobacterium arthrosphaerae TaxID=651561 RepID=UPI003D351908